MTKNDGTQMDNQGVVMCDYFGFKRVGFVLLLLVFLWAGPACGGDSVARTVGVTFEIQLINAQATSWGMGIAGGKGTSGMGASNETIREHVYAKVGDRVFVKAFTKHWDSNDPAHQVIGRIIVEDEEIYMCSDQGGAGQTTKIECGGPVYIPDKNKRNE